MITLLEGPSARLWGHCANLATENGPGDGWVVLAPPLTAGPTQAGADLDVPWYGIRRLVEWLRSNVDPPRVTRVLELDAPASFLALGAEPEGLGRPLTGDEAREVSQLAASRLSHLSHNLLVQHALFERWAVLLRELAALVPSATLVVPELCRLDRESLSALRRLIRRFPEAAPDLVAGYDPRAPEEVAGEDGLTWMLPQPDVWRLVLGLRTLDATRVEVLEAEGPELVPSSPPVSADVGMPRGTVSSGTLSLQGQLRGIRDAFAGFAFTAALRRGLTLIGDAAAVAALSSRERAEMHALVALSGHNRQFRSDGNLPLGRFLERHLRASWDLEPEEEPALRSTTAYRLAVVLGRRLKQRQVALDWADRSIEEARRVPCAEQAAHLEAWGRNIRAYLLMGLERVEEAVDDCRRAFALVDEQVAEAGGAAAAVSPDALLRELAYTRSLLADNLGALLLLRGRVGEPIEGEERIEEVAVWKRRSDELAEHAPALVRFENRAWLVLYREQGRLAAALPKALEGAAAAREEQDALRWLHYTVHAADLEYRLGHAEAAYEHFTEASSLRGQIGDPPFLRDLTLFRAAAARRAGRQAVAAALLDELLGRHTWMEDPRVRNERAHLLALRGEVDALRSRPKSAQTWINEAIELALQDGVRDTMLGVALAAARASRHLGEREDAAEAYAQAMELASMDSEPMEGEPMESKPVESEPDAALPVLRLEAIVGYLGSRDELDADRRVELLRQALVSLPAALDDGDAWWLLASLLRRVQAIDSRLLQPQTLLPYLRGGELGDDAELRRALSLLWRAAAQREDCAHLLRDLGVDRGSDL